jgi:hypothetical protein
MMTKPLDAVEVSTSLHDLARVGYEAYAAQTEGLTFDGRPMPKYGDLPMRVVLAWAAAALAISSTGKKEAT